jgi:hypothetical protein
MDPKDISHPACLVLAAVACAFVAVMVGAPQSRPATAGIQSRPALATPLALAKLRQSVPARMTIACLFGDTAMLDGEHIDLYREPNVAFGEHCVFESRYCSGGTLSDGYYTNRSCFVRPGPN